MPPNTLPYTSSTIGSPQNTFIKWYRCEYCYKEIQNGTLRNSHIYCNLRHAILGALKGEQK